MSTEQVPLWVVVCEDLHMAVGPFTTVDEAIENAKDMTQNSACVYKPVKFVFNGEVRSDEADSGRGYGQYL